MAFEGLKLVATPKQDASDPASKRRQRLVMQIDHQLYMAEPENQGRKFRGRWWTIGIDGKPTLAIKYGKIPLELAKGKHAIACADIAGVVDAQLATVSEQVRARFKKGR